MVYFFENQNLVLNLQLSVFYNVLFNENYCLEKKRKKLKQDLNKLVLDQCSLQPSYLH